MSINRKLIEIICCPVCKSALKEDKSGKFLICDRCKIKYPIKDDIPILLVEEAIKFDEQTKNT